MASRTMARVYLSGGTCVGEIEVPRTDTDEAVIVRANAPSGAQALTAAADLADTLLANPLLAAVVPPQAHVAIAATRELANAAAAGGGLLRSLWKSIKGPGKKRLAKALMRTTPVYVSDVGATVVRDHRKRPRRSITMGPSRPRTPQQSQYPYPPDPYGGYYGGYPPPGYGGYPQQGYGGYDPYAGYGYPQPGYPQQQYYGYPQQPAYYPQQPYYGGYPQVDPMTDQNYVDQMFQAYGY